MAKIDVALIGAGGMANSVHYPSLVDFEDVNLVGLCDLVESRCHETANRFGIENRYTNYQKMINDTSPTAVYVLMPPQDLFVPVIDCLQRGIHVFVEKPLGLTTYQAREMAQLAEKNSCLTMVGFNRRFIPLLRQVKSEIESEKPIIQCMSVFHKNSPNALYYKGQIDILTCDAIHAVDTLRWMGGSDVQAVASDINSFGSERENSFNALVKFKSGTSGFLCTNWAVGGRIHIFEIHASGISAYINPDLDGQATIHKQSGITTISTVDAAGSNKNHVAYGFYAENRHFIDCIQKQILPETNFNDATQTMELVDLIYQNRIG